VIANTSRDSVTERLDRGKSSQNRSLDAYPLLRGTLTPTSSRARYGSEQLFSRIADNLSMQCQRGVTTATGAPTGEDAAETPGRMVE
jgi:hypothetical protein